MLAAVQRLREDVEQPVGAAAEAVEVVGVDGPNDDSTLNDIINNGLVQIVSRI